LIAEEKETSQPGAARQQFGHPLAPVSPQLARQGAEEGAFVDQVDWLIRREGKKIGTDEIDRGFAENVSCRRDGERGKIERRDPPAQFGQVSRLPGAAAAGNQRIERRRLAGDEVGKGFRHLAGIPGRDTFAEAFAPEIGMFRTLFAWFYLARGGRLVAHVKIAAFEILAACRFMTAPSKIIIASRESRLAMWQAVHVQGRLASLNPGSEVVILGMTTKGDQILDRPLAEIGGKGLFIKELEVAMQEGKAHLAVHSMKDVPMVMPEGFVLAAISARENPRDAFVSNKFNGLDDLPAGAVVGTSSLRRESILRAKYPQLVIKSLRGNLDTRLKKLDAGEYDAIILAAAGLIRLGLENRIKSVLTAEQSLPAPGQGALGIELIDGAADMADVVAPLNDPDTAHCVKAERAFSRALGGSCQVPLGGYAIIENGQLWLRGFVATADGKEVVSAELRGNPADDEALGLQLAAELRAKGADAILEKLAHCK